MLLYKRQKEVVEKTVRALRKDGRALLDMATGLGKTVIAAHAVKRLKSHRVLFLAHDGDIVEQAAGVFAAVCNRGVGLYVGTRKERTADFVFATLQGLRRNPHAFAHDDFDLVVVDEAHHAKADTYEDVITRFSGMRLGLTATRERLDARDITEIFGEPTVSVTLEEAVASGDLNPFEYRIVSDALNLEALRKLAERARVSRDVSMKDVNRTLFIERRDKEIAARIKAAVGRRKTLVFCRNIQHADRVARLLGRGAETYHSKLPKSRQRDILPRFRVGASQFLVVVNKANEGVDVPDAEAVVFLRETNSRALFLQQLGRSLRKLPNKRETLVLDFVGSIERLLMLREFVGRVGQHTGTGSSLAKELVTLSGSGFLFEFDEQAVDALKMLADLRHRDYYPTWQEASAAARSLGITARRQLERRYLEDPRLPANPRWVYQDYPGGAVFFDKSPARDRGNFYPTWKEASRAARRLGFTTGPEYFRGYKVDPRLSSVPHETYPDFPGWKKFLGTDERFYATLNAASRAARKLGIRTQREYFARRSEDPRLPFHPRKKYKDFPGWEKFLGKK